jgi:hypothetical protein
MKRKLQLVSITLFILTVTLFINTSLTYATFTWELLDNETFVINYVTQSQDHYAPVTITDMNLSTGEFDGNVYSTYNVDGTITGSSVSFEIIWGGGLYTAFNDTINSDGSLSGGVTDVASNGTWYGPSSAIAGTMTDATPVPGTVWLFGSGLAGLIGFKRKYSG